MVSFRLGWIVAGSAFTVNCEFGKIPMSRPAKDATDDFHMRITMNISRTRTLLLVVSFIVASAGVSVAAAGSNITNVKVAQDLRAVKIFADRDLGRHRAFVIKNPYRLVLDFESTGLGRVQRKIGIGQEGMSEIRLGVSGSKARVVVDFGDAEVPPYTIRRDDKMLVVFLSEAPRAKSPEKKRIQAKPKENVRPQTKKSKRRSSKAETKSSLAIRSAGVTGKMVFFELADRKNPKRHYRFAMEIDTKKLRPGQLSMTDSQGRVECFRVIPESPDIASGEKSRDVDTATNAEVKDSGDYSGEEGRFPWGRREVREQETSDAGKKKPKAEPGIAVKIRKLGPAVEG
jgi:AMIN domain